MNLREQLKQSTREPHSRLDAAIRDLEPFARQENYRVYLQLMLELHIRCRDSLAYVERKANLDSHECSLVDLIADDLKSLGVAFAQCSTERRAVEQCLNPETENAHSVAADGTKTDSRMWAEAYVMEGSAMGGMLMFRQAQKNLPPECGRRYLEQLSKDAAGRWRDFVAALVAVEQELDSVQAVEAAKSLFDDAYQVFGKLSTKAGSDQT